MSANISIYGRIGEIKEIKVFGENKILNFSVATSYKTKEGDQWIEKTMWHNITAWNKQAEIIEKFVKKGDRFNCFGELTETKKDDKVYRGVKLIAFDLIETKKESEAKQQAPASFYDESKDVRNNNASIHEAEADDLPF